MEHLAHKNQFFAVVTREKTPIRNLPIRYKQTSPQAPILQPVLIGHTYILYVVNSSTGSYP